MKNLIKIMLTILSLLILTTACDSYLDVEPEQSISSEVVYSTSDGVVNALNGAWERISGAQTPTEGGELFGGTSVFFNEFIADNGDGGWTGTFIQYRNMINKALDPTDYTVRDFWLRAYDAINLTNNVVANISVVDEDEKDRVEGEAKFLRGIMYFELIKLYGLPYEPTGGNTQLGVPLILEPTTGVTEESYPSRASVEDVYTQILLDLNAAKSLLGASTGAGENGGRATSTVASAFLARVYLQQGDYTNAVTEANIVIGSGAFSLNGTPLACFNNDDYTNEDVFMILQNTTNNAGQSNDGLATFFASLPGLGRGDFVINPQHLARYEAGDLRSGVTLVVSGDISTVDSMFYVGTGQKSGQVMCSKWGSYDTNIPIIRLAEMYLIRAEGNFEEGTSVGDTPLNDINRIRGRAGLGALGTVDQAAIRNERRLELAWEGQALNDVKRWQINVGALPYNDPTLVLPIPQREMDVNENLEQNPGYLGG